MYLNIASELRPAIKRLKGKGLRKLLLVTGYWMLIINASFGQIVGDFRTNGNVTFAAAANWQRYDGSAWGAAGAAPVIGDNIITIRTGNTATVTANKALDQVVVASGGVLTVNSGQNLIIPNGVGTDLSVSGIINNSGTITPGGTIVFNASSAYNHTRDGGTIPDATWNASSNCNITGVTGNVPDGLSQSFGNFTWNCIGQTGNDLNINPLEVGNGGAVTGDFTLISTGTGSIRLSNNANRVLDISGKFIISGGIFHLAIAGGSATINIGGDFNMTGGTLTETGSSSGIFVFENGGTTQNFRRTVGTISNNIGFTVNSNVTIDFGISDYANGAGTFTISNGATLQTANTTGVNGSIQTTSRSLSTSANYTFDGTAAQVTGTYLPATVKDFRINNVNGITLTNSVTSTGTLYMNSGNINTGANTFILSNPVSSALNYTGGIIVGRFERFINTTSANYFFPVGTTAQIQSLTANFINLIAGSLLVQYISGDGGNSGLPLTDGDGSQITNQFTSGYWSAMAKNSLASTNYNIDLNATGFGPYAINAGTRLIKRTDTGGSWLLNGTHSDVVGSVVKRAGMSGIYNLGGGTQFGIGRSGPRIITQPSNKTVCGNATASFSLVASGYALIYQWYKVSGILLTNDGHYGGVNTSTLSITNIVFGDAGNYYSIVTDGHGSTVQSTLASLIVNALPTAVIAITDNSGIANNDGIICNGATATLTASGGTSYIWSSGETTAAVVKVATGTTSVIVTDANGCTDTKMATITVNSLPTTPIITAGGPTTFCAGGSVTLTSSSETSYLWSNGAISQSINVTTGGNYTVKVTNANGCQSALSTATVVTVNALPATPVITAGGPTIFCTGGSVTLSSSAASDYLWSNEATTPAINITTSGSYSVHVTNANGCQSPPSLATVVTVNVLPSTPTITAGGPITFCAGGSVTLTSSAGSSYLWSNAATTPGIDVITGGSYSVQVTDANGCQSIPSVPTAVIVNSLPVTPTITAGGPTAFCAGGSVTLNSSAGTSYLWSTGATTSGITVASSGNYAVQVTNVNGCQSTASVATIVTVNALPPTPTITASGPTTLCAGGSVTLTSNAGTNYLWSTGAFTPDIIVTTAGSYTVQVTNVNGCHSAPSATTVVNINALPSVNAGTAATIPNGTSTTIDATVSGTGPFTYSWLPPGLLVNPLIEDPTTVNLPTTTIFTLTATSVATSCSNSSTVTITISGGPLNSTPSATPGTVCAGEIVQLNANAGGGSGTYSYNWTSTPAGFTSSVANPIANPAVTTTYNVSVFDGFTTVNSQMVVTVNAIPITPTITADGPTTFCEGNSVTLTSGAGTSYLWSNGATTPAINVSAPGSYSVQITNTSGCQSVPSTATIVMVNALPGTPTIAAAGPTTFCSGGSVILTSSAGTSYLWSTGGTTPSINVTSSGSYTVRVTNANGCQSTVSAVTVVTVNTLPGTPTITADGPTTFCEGGNVNLTSSAGNTYLWSTGATTPSINVTLSGSYTVRVINTNGCQSTASSATLVTVNALPVTPTITAGGPTTFCAGSNVTLTSSAGTSYTWSTGAITPSINVTTAGSYTVKVTNTYGCQSATSAAKVVTVNALPVTPTITAGGPTTFCAGGNVTLNSSAGTSYLWSNGTTTPVLNVTTAGSYTVQVTNANGCQSAPSVATIVTVNALPATPVITIDGPTTFCAGGIVTLTSSPETSYLWSNAAITPVINVTSTGSYSVQVTNANGCQSVPSAATVVTVNILPPTPTITAGSPTTFCAGGSVILTSSAGTSYLWSSGGTTSSINVTSSGSYTVRVTNANGCQSTASAVTVVTVNTLPGTPTITADGPTTFCEGGNVNLTSSAGNTYLWSTGATTPSINVTLSGSYTVRVINTNGCQSTASSTTLVTVNALPITPTITAVGPITFCTGGSVTLTSSEATSYLWSTGATTPDLIVTTTGSYTVQVTNVSGCHSVPSPATVVTVNTIPSAPTITASGPVTFCDGGSVTLTSSAEASYLWSNAASTQSINATKAGSYTVQVTSADGCQSALSDATIVTVNTLPSDPTITADGPTSFCDGGNVTLTSSFGTGYLWSNGATVQSINVANSGNFTAQTSNVNGCMSNSSPIVKVTVNSIPQVNISSSSSSLCISDQRNLTGNPSGGTFTILSGPGIINGNILSATGSGTINLEYFYSNSCSNKAIQSINVDKNVIADAGPDQKLLYVFETQMAAVFPQYGAGEWSLISGSGDINDILSPTTRITGLSIGENKFIWKVSNGSCVSSDEVIIEVSDIVTPTVITPNEDGLNDELIFPGLQAFPGSSIMIYNRWGSEVYRNSDYKNDWKGKDKNNRDLQPDTYYYILRISNGRIIKGFIEIRR